MSDPLTDEELQEVVRRATRLVDAYGEECEEGGWSGTWTYDAYRDDLVSIARSTKGVRVRVFFGQFYQSAVNYNAETGTITPITFRGLYRINKPRLALEALRKIMVLDDLANA